jgi:hypothetical protein
MRSLNTIAKSKGTDKSSEIHNYCEKYEKYVLSSHAFFENAGGSYPCAQVVDRLHRFYTDRKVQPYGP